MFWSLLFKYLIPYLICLGLPTLLLFTLATNPKITVYHYRTAVTIGGSVVTYILLGCGGNGYVLTPLVIVLVLGLLRTPKTLLWQDLILITVLILFTLLLPELTTLLENLLVLEFVALALTASILFFLYKQNPSACIAKVVTPYIIINFLGYMLVLILLLCSANPSLTQQQATPLNWLVITYVALKFLLLPLTILKDPFYKLLTVKQICWLLTLQLLLFLPLTTNIITLFNVTITAASAPLFIILTVFVLRNLVFAQNIKHLFLFSTPLFTIILFTALTAL